MEIKTDTIYNIDCIELMQQMKKDKIVVDWVITDPPYGIGVGSMPYTNGFQMVGKALAKRRDYSNTGDWDNSKIDKKYFDLIFQISNC